MRRVTAVAILLVLPMLGACGGKKQVESVATPIAAGTDVSFEDFLINEPSASPTTAPTSAPGVGTSSSNGTRATARPAAPTAAAKTACPSGQVTAKLLSFDASESGDSSPAPDGTQEYRVRASGTVHNQTNGAIRDVRVELTVQLKNRGADSDTTVVRQTMGAGSQATWNADFDFDAEDEPKERDATVAVARWSWADGAFSHCWSG